MNNFSNELSGLRQLRQKENWAKDFSPNYMQFMLANIAGSIVAAMAFWGGIIGIYSIVSLLFTPVVAAIVAFPLSVVLFGATYIGLSALVWKMLDESSIFKFWKSKLAKIDSNKTEILERIGQDIQASFDLLNNNSDKLNSDELIEHTSKALEGTLIRCSMGTKYFTLFTSDKIKADLFGFSKGTEYTKHAEAGLQELLALSTKIETAFGRNTLSNNFVELVSAKQMLIVYQTAYSKARINLGGLFFGFSLKGKVDTLGSEEQIAQAQAGMNAYEPLSQANDALQKLYDARATLKSDPNPVVSLFTKVYLNWQIKRLNRAVLKLNNVNYDSKLFKTHLSKLQENLSSLIQLPEAYDIVVSTTEIKTDDKVEITNDIKVDTVIRDDVTLGIDGDDAQDGVVQTGESIAAAALNVGEFDSPISQPGDRKSTVLSTPSVLELQEFVAGNDEDASFGAPSQKLSQ